MSKVNYEQRLVDDFKDIYGRKKDIKICNCNVRARKQCDLKFEIKIKDTKETVCLEVKSDESSNKCNNVLLFMGDIIKNRRLHKEESDVSYGAFLQVNKDVDKSYFVNRIKDSFSEADWNTFGEKFKCKYIFFYDKDDHELYYAQWANFVPNGDINKWEESNTKDN